VNEGHSRLNLDLGESSLITNAKEVRVLGGGEIFGKMLQRKQRKHSHGMLIESKEYYEDLWFTTWRNINRCAYKGNSYGRQSRSLLPCVTQGSPQPEDLSQPARYNVLPFCNHYPHISSLQ